MASGDDLNENSLVWGKIIVLVIETFLADFCNKIS